MRHKIALLALGLLADLLGVQAFTLAPGAMYRVAQVELRAPGAKTTQAHWAVVGVFGVAAIAPSRAAARWRADELETRLAQSVRLDEDAAAECA